MTRTSGTTLFQSPIVTDQIPRVQQIGRPLDESHRVERGNDLPLLYVQLTKIIAKQQLFYEPKTVVEESEVCTTTVA